MDKVTNSAIESGKLLYFDPNNVTVRGVGENLTAIFNGLELIKDPEDYSIAVDLEVVNKSRNNVTTNDAKVFSLTNSKNPTNFLQGKNIGDTNVLSTFFSDIKFSENEPNSLNEAMCINSIDIEFTSWYVASVIIKFTDIRGSALFSPSEASVSKGENGKIGGESIFSSFFTMPYPIFKLKVKGFYGNTVTYPLHLTDFKSEFNSEKGNMDITCHFIGYTYAMLNDIQMTYLIAAPNCTEGDAYWTSQIKNDRFKTLEGRELPKISQLLQKIKDGENAKSDMDANDSTVKIVKELNEQEGFLKEIKTNIDYYISALSNYYTVKTTGNLYDLTITRTDSKTSVLSPEMGGNNAIGTYILNLGSLVTKFNNAYKANTLFLKYDKPIEIFKLKIITPDRATLNLSDIVNRIDIYLNESNNEKKNLGDQVAGSVNNRLSEIYGMIPSIYNFTKVLLAHMETLLHIIGECANNVTKDKRDDQTTAGNQETDIIGNKLSPFPWFTVDKKDEWIGNYYPGIPEVKLVNSLLKAKHDITAELQKLESQPPTANIAQPETTLTIGDVWIPINAFDNSISKIGGKNIVPYSNLNSSTAHHDETKALLSNRITTIVGLSSDLSYNKENYDSFVMGESKNIIRYLGQNKETINNVVSVLRGLDEKLKDDEIKKRGKYKPLTKYETDNGSFYEYDLLKTKGLLPLNDDLISQRENYIIGGAITGATDTTLRFYKPRNITGSTNYNKYPPTNTIIVDGTADCKNIYDNWFLRVQTLYDPNTETDIRSMMERYKLSRKESSESFIDVLYEEQPLLNKIAYLKKEPGSGNQNYINTLNENCGLTDAPFDSKDDVFVNFYKAYLGENDWESVKDKPIEKLSAKIFIENENIDLATLTYPMIGGLYDKNYTRTEKNKKDKNARRIFCLFGSEIYYHQNSIITANPNNDYAPITANRAKAYLFLQSLPIKIKSFDDLINDPNQLDRSFMVRLPKAEALLIGSMLWEHSDDGKINIPEDYLISKEANKYRYLRTPEGAFIIKKTSGFRNLFSSVTSLIPFLGTINKHKEIKEQLINFFYDWVNSDAPDGWVTIRNAFEFKGINNELFDSQKFLDLANKLFEGTVSDINNELHEDRIKNYYNISPLTTDTIGLINKDGSDGVKSIISLLFNECIVAYSGDGVLYQPNREFGGTTLSYRKVSAIKDGIIQKLREQSQKIEADGIVSPDGSTTNVNSLSVIDDENINLQMYRYLKNLYDKWVSGFQFNADESEYKWIDVNKSIVNGYKDTHDLINFKFIDRSYNNIGEKFIINFNDVIQNMIGLDEQKTLYSTITDILSKNQFLFIPMPNYQSWTTPTDFAKIFQPIPYSQADMDSSNWTSIFICMYTGTPSRRLNIGSKSYMYQDDALNLNINETNNIDTDFQTTAEKDLENTSLVMNKVPAFAVSYGKQNQSYFKNITLNQNDPVTTEASINVLRQINDRTDKKSAVTTTTQDMYNLYSDYAYTCNVEMLGCAQIQPMMYFQLTNIPMWNGAYLIYKVNHAIRPGSMTTNFTGMRMSKNYPKLVTPGIITSDRLNNTLNVTPESSLVSTLSWDTKIGKYFTLSQYCTTDYGTGKAHVDEVFEYIVSRLQNNLAPTIDSIYDTWIVSPEGKKYGKFRITSGYRPSTPSSQHAQGLAADIQLEKPNNEGNEALFRHIISRMNAGLKMDQLINESNDKKSSWCHVSPICFKNNVVDVRGQYSYGALQSSGKTTLTDIMYSENAKGNGKIIFVGDELEKFIKYIKGAENGILAGWDKNTQLWKPYGSAQVTIGYGIVFKLDGKLNVVTPQMKDAINPYLNDTTKIRVTNQDMERELRTQISNGLTNIKRDLNKLYGEGTYDNMKDKYKYAIYDLYHNFGPSGYKEGANLKENKPINIRFIEAAVNNDLTGMINNADRIVNGTLLPDRTARFKEYLNS